MAFRILSIDGGGLRGIVAVLILQELERRTGSRIFELFDLVAGTSAGAFVTCGVVATDNDTTPRSTLEEVARVYTERGKELFPPKSWAGRQVRKITSLFGPEFGPRGIDAVLAQMAGNLTLQNCLRPVFIPAFDLNHNEALLFKTRQAFTEPGGNARLYDICRATSAAPAFLPPYAFEFKGKDRLCIDGGIFMNNPALGALAEASRYRQYYGIADFSDISVLSVGTGDYTAEPARSKVKGFGKLGWAGPISDIMMQGVNQTTSYACEEMLGRGNYLRVTIDIDNKKYANFTDARDETLRYIVGKVTADVLQNERLMQRLVDFVRRQTVSGQTVR
jgi:hypothetical protein